MQKLKIQATHLACTIPAQTTQVHLDTRNYAQLPVNLTTLKFEEIFNKQMLNNLSNTPLKSIWQK